MTISVCILVRQQLHRVSDPWTRDLGKSLNICYHLEKTLCLTLQTFLHLGWFFLCLLLRHKFRNKFSVSAVSLSLQLNWLLKHLLCRSIPTTLLIYRCHCLKEPVLNHHSVLPCSIGPCIHHLSAWNSAISQLPFLAGILCYFSYSHTFLIAISLPPLRIFPLHSPRQYGHSRLSLILLSLFKLVFKRLWTGYRL